MSSEIKSPGSRNEPGERSTTLENATATDSIIPDTHASIEFLKKWSPENVWVLTSIIPDGKTETRTFNPSEMEKAAKWIEGYQGKRNLYFHVNPVRHALSNKASKEDIASMAWLHCDLDPRAQEDFNEERKRALRLLRDFMPKPTVIIDSGGGFQGFWKLKLSEKLEINGEKSKAQELEAYNRQLEIKFQGDHCHNIDRIMRLPGTINVPNAKKLKKGRKPALAKLVEWNEVSYPLSAFTPAPPLHNSANVATGDAPRSIPLGEGTAVSTDDLRAWGEANQKAIQDHTLALIATGANPLDPQRYPSRSEALFRAVCDLVRLDVPEEMIFGAITDPNNAISASVREQRNWQAYAQRQIENARAACADPILEEMNKKHAVLLQEGGKTRVLSWERTELDEDRQVPVLQSFEDFRNRYMHRYVEFQTDKGVAQKPLGKWWLEHPQRREYFALRFFPGKPEEVDGYLNMWRGYAVLPKAGDWSQMREHVRRVLANGDETCADYIIKWAA